MTRDKGFTLVELMITLVIAAILISIAVPSYRRYIIRSQRSDAISALTRVQAAQEKYFLQNNTYATDMAQLQLSTVSDGGFYDIGLDARDDGGEMEFIATATPRASTGQTQDERCQLFEVDHTGVRKAKDSDETDRTDECWR